MQEDLQDLAAAAASAVQQNLSAAEDAAHSPPVDALKACSALRASLVDHAAELQRWAVSLQVESVRQSSASKKLAEREAAAAKLAEVEAEIEVQKAAVKKDNEEIRVKKVCCALCPYGLQMLMS